MGPFDLRSGETITIEKFGVSVEIWLTNGYGPAQKLLSYNTDEWYDLSGYDLSDCLDTAVDKYRRGEHVNA